MERVGKGAYLMVHFLKVNALSTYWFLTIRVWQIVLAVRKSSDARTLSMGQRIAFPTLQDTFKHSKFSFENK